MSCNIDRRHEDQGRIWPFGIHGQLSPLNGFLRIADRAHSHYAQLYIIDTERAIDEHMQNSQQLLPEPQVNCQIIERLTHMLHEYMTSFIKQFEKAYERL